MHRYRKLLHLASETKNKSNILWLAFTYDFVGVVVSAAGAEVVVEVSGLVDVEAGVDLHPELLAVGVVQLPVAVVDLDRLTLPTPPQRVFAACITDGRLQYRNKLYHL